LLIEPCIAPVTTPDNPSTAPDVSVEIHKKPEWIPPEERTDPYTGEVIWSSPGYYTTSGIIEITIKNRPFIPYNDTNHIYNIYYCVFWKIATHEWQSNLFPNPVVYQSDSDYTVITLTYDERSVELPDILIGYIEDMMYDCRIQAVEGYFNLGSPPNYFDAVFEGEGSAFTEFTITIPARDKPGTIKPTIQPTSIIPSPNTSNPPQSTQQRNIIIIIIIIIILVSVCTITILLTVIAYQYKQRTQQIPEVNRHNNYNNGFDVLINFYHFVINLNKRIKQDKKCQFCLLFQMV
jgi:hypothetical protein